MGWGWGVLITMRNNNLYNSSDGEIPQGVDESERIRHLARQDGEGVG